MKRLQDIKRALAPHKGELNKNFKVKKIGIFGSYVRDEHNEKSDIDVLVEFSGGGISYFAFYDLRAYLKKILRIRKVDLVTKGALKPIMGRRIMKEVVFV
jgi:predicted nucleotidyltransferase